jgi:hypothetical protein
LTERSAGDPHAIDCASDCVGENGSRGTACVAAA